MSTSLINVRVEASLKHEKKVQFSFLGLNMTSTIDMFPKEVIVTTLSIKV